MSKPKTQTKTHMVFEHLVSGKTLTAMEALALFGVFRLASIIHNLRGEGYAIKTEHRFDTNGTAYARYSLPIETWNGAHRQKAA